MILRKLLYEAEIDPLNDLETIKTEIFLSDIDIIQKKLEKGKKKLLSSIEIQILEKKLDSLNEGKEDLSLVCYCQTKLVY